MPAITSERFPVPDLKPAQQKTYSLDPLSLGNPIVAATLQVHGPQAPAAATTATRASATVPANAVFTRNLAIARGDTLMPKLVKAGIPRAEAHAAIVALGEHFDPRRLRPGQALTLSFRDDGMAAASADKATFLGLELEVDYATRVAVARQEDGNFTAESLEASLSVEAAGSRGTIQSSLFDSAVDAGVPVNVLVSLIRAYSWDVDFQRDIQPGDAFEVMFEQFRDADGRAVHHGEVLFASLTLSGERTSIYLHTLADGATDYFDENGQSVRKALLRTPIDGARLSSRFGKRRHPILGYTRMHKGIDFAAPSGTPIYAAGDGTVDVAGRNGGYGRYVRIRHGNEYSTAYAHLKGYGKDIRSGARVRQGQVIGYVGTSGQSTGPHLHYEILRSNRQINPLDLKMPSGRKLEGAELESFAAARSALDKKWAVIDAATQVAEGGE